MLSFAGCNDNCTTPRDDQRHKYAKVEYGEYVKDGVYIAKGMYVAEGRYGEYAKEAASVEEGHNEPLANKGNDKPLAKNGYWAGCEDEPLVTRAIGRVHHARGRRASCHKGKWPRTSCQATISRIRVAYAMWGNDEPLTTIGDWATIFDNGEGAKAPMVRLIAPNGILPHCNEVP